MRKLTFMERRCLETFPAGTANERGQWTWTISCGHQDVTAEMGALIAEGFMMVSTFDHNHRRAIAAPSRMGFDAEAIYDMVTHAPS